MRRTELLQEIRKMRFEEAYGDWTEGRLSQGERRSYWVYVNGRFADTLIVTRKAV